MQSPPNYSGTGKKKSNVGLIIGIVVACVALCCLLPTVFIGKMGMDVFKNSVGMVGCAADMGAVRTGIVDYAKKNGGKLPSAVSWKKDISPYIQQPFLPPQIKAPTIESGICDPAGPTEIAYNSDVAGKKLTDVQGDDSIVLVFEMPGSSPNAAAKYKTLPLDQSPKIVAGQPRGWLSVCTYGDPYMIGKNGIKTPIASSNRGVKVQSNP